MFKVEFLSRVSQLMDCDFKLIHKATHFLAVTVVYLLNIFPRVVQKFSGLFLVFLSLQFGVALFPLLDLLETYFLKVLQNFCERVEVALEPSRVVVQGLGDG